MQSMFRLPWSSEPHGDKVMDNAPFHHKPRPRPAAVDLFALNKLKRKRTDSPDEALSPHNPHLVKKWKCAPGHGEVKPVVVDIDVAVDRATVIDGFATATAPAATAPATATAPVNHLVDSSAPATLESRREPADGGASAPAVAAPVPGNHANLVDSSIVPSATTDLSPKAPENVLEATATPASPETSSATIMTPLQQVIEAQFNYEILLKHNELRLIEQELAKCQVALEQIRRCEMVPYPGFDGLSQDMSSGIGAALEPPQGYSRPRYAAPWGVTDGPYTRHYAKWLIPDARFDLVSEQISNPAAHGQHAHAPRESRAHGNLYELPLSGKPRSSRTSTGGLKFQALGENPAPAPKIDPLIHKRSSDGQWVKLYCAECGHSNFSNTQGFLNHCRIKHNQVYKSHDAAANACGIPVNMDEVPPATTAPTTAVETPVSTPVVVSHCGTTTLPSLIRSNPTKLAPQLPPRTMAPPKASASTSASLSDLPQSTTSSSSKFTPSSQTPYMNSLLAQRGFSGDFSQIVDSARTKIDLDAIEPQSPDEDDVNAPTSSFGTKGKSGKLGGSSTMPAHIRSGAMTMPQTHAVGGKMVPSSRPPMRLPDQPSLTQRHSTSSSSSDASQKRNMPQSPVESELSPHPVESNPGLVSDYDDNDDEDFDDEIHESAVARSSQLLGRGRTGCSDGDFEMRDLVVEDGSDVLEVERRGRGSADESVHHHQQIKAPPSR